MSKKNRAQHNVPRRHGDRNVQTRYSGKHQEQHMEHSCGGACKGASRKIADVAELVMRGFVGPALPSSRR